MELTMKSSDQQTSRPADQQTSRPADQQTSRPADQQTSSAERTLERHEIMRKIRELELQIEKKDEEISKLRNANEGLAKVTETLLETNKKLTADWRTELP